jgi:hypothetical protein
VYYFFLAVVVIRYETTATTRRALLFIIRAFFNDTITVAVWTGFHVRLMGMLPHPAGASRIRFSSRLDNSEPVQPTLDRYAQAALAVGRP